MNINAIASSFDGLRMLDFYIESFRRRDFGFIVEGIADNSEGDWVEGDKAIHEKQRRALEILTDDEFDEFLYGGAAGGAKSWTGVCWLVFSCLCYEKTNWFIARKELKDLLGSVFKTFKKVCSAYGIESDMYKFNAVKNYIEFKNGSIINFEEVSYKPSDPMYESLGSFEYTGGWIEEIGEVHEMAAIVLATRIGRHLNKRDANGRLREKSIKKKLFMTCNPKQNWGKTKFYDKHKTGLLYEENKIPLKNGRKRPQRIYLNCLVTENPFIEQDYIDGLYAKAIDHKPTYERLLKGNWDYEDNPYQLAEQEMIDGIFDNDHITGSAYYITADVARYGSDKAVLIAWKGWVVKQIITFDISSTQDIAHGILYLRNKFSVPKSRCIADGDGVGGGVVDITGIKEFRNNGKVIRVNAQTPNYRNLQVQCLYMLAEKINKGELHIEADLENKVKEDIKVELAQIQSKPNQRDATKLDCKLKSEIKQDIGRSPDYRDAFLMRVWFDLKPKRRVMMSSKPRNIV